MFAGMSLSHQYMPLADNVFFDWGLGPIFSGDTVRGCDWPVASQGVLAFISLASAIGAGLVLSNLWLGCVCLKQQVQSGMINNRGRLGLLCLILIFLFLLVDCLRGFFDRYLIVILPFLMAQPVSLLQSESLSFKRCWERICLAVAALLLFALGYFSGVATHDYLAYNRARWQALDSLTIDQHVSPLEVDGGLEFNGWWSYDQRYRSVAVVFDPSMKHGDRYVVALHVLPGYTVTAQIDFQRWLVPGQGKIYVLKRLTM